MNKKRIARLASAALLVGAFALPVSTAQAAPDAAVVKSNVQTVPTPIDRNKGKVSPTRPPSEWLVTPLSNGPYP